MGSNRFRRERLARLGEIEAGHFWFAARRRLVRRLIQAHAAGRSGRALDVGCGTGANLDLLAGPPLSPVGLDGHLDGLLAPRAAGRAVVQADATRLPFVSGAFAAVSLLDVAEHVDDAALLTEVARVLGPAGIAFVSVPALPGLWSWRDVDAGHLRRYTRGGLRSALERAALRVRETRYFQCLLLPVAFATRRLGRRGPALRDREDAPGPVLNALFGAVLRLELALGAFVRWPAGSSLFAVAEKP